MNTSQIKTISYTGSLWRADKNSSSIYSNTNIKYFALSDGSNLLRLLYNLIRLVP